MSSGAMITDEMVIEALHEYVSGDHDTPEQAMRAAITAALAKAWRPIEEAEKDWTSRLLYLPNTGIKIDIGHYDLIKRGWVAFKSLGIVSPTHWMPLPEPPAPPATKEAGER